MYQTIRLATALVGAAVTGVAWVGARRNRRADARRVGRWWWFMVLDAASVALEKQPLPWRTVSFALVVLAVLVVNE